MSQLGLLSSIRGYRPGEREEIGVRTRWATTLLVAGALVLSVPTSGATQALPADPEGRALAKAFPFCSWWVVTTPQTMNVAYPDTSAIYWTTPFYAKRGESIIVEGTFPQARFMSLTVYDNTFDYFTNNGVDSQIDDYQIVPNRGSLNPWAATSDLGASAGGSFTVSLMPRVTSGIPNALPILPENPQKTELFPADLGFLIYRVYLPEGGMGAVSLPRLTLVDAAGKKTPLSRCAGQGQEKVAKVAEGVKLLALLRKLKDGGSGAAPEPCAKSTGGCPPNLQFFRPTPAVTGRLFPNNANAYAAMTFKPTSGQAVVIRLLAPTSPSGVGGGTSPVPWPSQDYQLRYWSLCNNIYAAPFPVVANRKLGGGTTYGCIPDSQAVVNDSGYATFVITKPLERPRNATSANGYNWLPTSIKQGSTTEMVALRNMLPSAAFDSSVLAANPDGVPADAAQAMGEYYPEVVTCPIKEFEDDGCSSR